MSKETIEIPLKLTTKIKGWVGLWIACSLIFALAAFSCGSFASLTVKTYRWSMRTGILAEVPRAMPDRCSCGGGW